MQVTPSYKATVVLGWYVSGPRLMVVSIVIINEAKHKTFSVRGFHCETNTGPCIFSLCYFNSSNCCSLFSTLSAQRHCNVFCHQKRHAWPRPLHKHIAHTSLWNNMAHRERIDVPKYNFFFDSLATFRHYFAGNGKVSCILATISDWFPNKRF